ncbi:MAG: hypothetical protein H6R26_788 [Proteobacteria bacterium]|nr:hypothetical protein [Pseudomonadota bacterium]
MLKAVLALLSFAALALNSADAPAARIGHHGGLLLHCDPPQFFDETPVKDSSVSSFQQFSVTASDNTDPSTVKVWVNNEPVAVSVSVERSGRLLVQGSLAAPITSGKAWVRVTGDSKDGCDELYVWNVYIR